jgi:hypothetical protein
VRRFCKATQTAHQRNAGLGNCVHLPREHDDVDSARFTAAQASPQLTDVSLFFIFCCRDLNRRHAAIEKSRRHRFRRIAFQLPGNRFAAQ